MGAKTEALHRQVAQWLVEWDATEAHKYPQGRERADARIAYIAEKTGRSEIGAAVLLWRARRLLARRTKEDR